MLAMVTSFEIIMDIKFIRGTFWYDHLEIFCGVTEIVFNLSIKSTKISEAVSMTFTPRYMVSWLKFFVL